jgi:hypothetical protein
MFRAEFIISILKSNIYALPQPCLPTAATRLGMVFSRQATTERLEKMIATRQAATATRQGMTDRTREMISTRQGMIPPSRVAVAPDLSTLVQQIKFE